MFLSFNCFFSPKEPQAIAHYLLSCVGCSFYTHTPRELLRRGNKAKPATSKGLSLWQSRIRFPRQVSTSQIHFVPKIQPVY